MVRRLVSGSVAFLALAASAWASPESTHGRPFHATQPRLVVFEMHGVHGTNCIASGSAIDDLAELYDRLSRPVVFVEYHSDEPLGIRMDRWYAAYDGVRDCYLPLIVVDSGWQWSCGWENFRPVYSAFVDQALARPAGAEVAARYNRSGDDLEVWVQVVNRSGRTLGQENGATVNAIVYENERVQNTDRFARAANDVPIETPLADGGEATFRIGLDNVPVNRWDRAVVLALVDYMPNAGSERHESLQAAIATEAPGPTATHPPSATPSQTATPTPSDTPSPTATATATATGGIATTVVPEETATPSAPAPATATGEPTQGAVFLPVLYAMRR